MSSAYRSEKHKTVGFFPSAILLRLKEKQATHMKQNRVMARGAKQQC